MSAGAFRVPTITRTVPELSVPGSGRIVVGAVEAERTFALRQQILRPHQRVEEMAFPGFDVEGAGSFAALTEKGEVVSTAVVAPEDPPSPVVAAAGPGRGWRLRGMATRPELRSSGIGSAVLDAVVSHVAEAGGGVLWCSARTPAQAFYERAGFAVAGERWDSPDLGPHVMMWRRVLAAETKGDRHGG